MDVVFTPAAVLDLLSQIDELQNYNLAFAETPDGDIQITIGESIYKILSETAEEVSVSEDVIDTVEDINEDAYEDLLDSEDFESAADVVESGIVKEAIKSLLLGGAIKFIKKLL